MVAMARLQQNTHKPPGRVAHPRLPAAVRPVHQAHAFVRRYLWRMVQQANGLRAPLPMPVAVAAPKRLLPVGTALVGVMPACQQYGLAPVTSKPRQLPRRARLAPRRKALRYAPKGTALQAARYKARVGAAPTAPAKLFGRLAIARASNPQPLAAPWLTANGVTYYVQHHANGTVSLGAIGAKRVNGATVAHSKTLYGFTAHQTQITTKLFVPFTSLAAAQQHLGLPQCGNAWLPVASNAKPVLPWCGHYPRPRPAN